MTNRHNVAFGVGALVVFVGALIAGTACSLTSKVMLSMKSVGITGEIEDFSFPLFQTFGISIINSLLFINIAFCPRNVLWYDCRAGNAFHCLKISNTVSGLRS